MPHLVATLIYLSQNYSYYIRGDRSPITHTTGNGYCKALGRTMSLSQVGKACLKKTGFIFAFTDRISDRIAFQSLGAATETSSAISCAPHAITRFTRV